MSRPEDIGEILAQLHTGQWWGWSDPSDKVYEKITVHDASKTLPTKEWLETELASKQAAWDAQDYARSRASEYPSIDELIVALWEGVVEERMAAVTKLEAKRQAVKLKYPK
jgi:hypothetical protein